MCVARCKWSLVHTLVARLLGCMAAAAAAALTGLMDKKLSYRGDSARRQSLRRLRSFKVTDFGTDRKPYATFYHRMYNNNTNFYPISHRIFSKLSRSRSVSKNFRFRQEIPLFNALVLSNICEYHNKVYNYQKRDSSGYV